MVHPNPPGINSISTLGQSLNSKVDQLQLNSSSCPVEIDEDRIVAEFSHLLEKSKHIFNGLRDLPPYGHKQYQAYFGRAFDTYTKIWKYQQHHRSILDKKYGLKRWQIGEIANNIGQLYYHFYLRTSETNYLFEAYQFYGAIRARGYYSKKEERSDLNLMVKKLRYFARFIVVCFLLKKSKTIAELLRELTAHIEDYTMYEPEDQQSMEWSLVLEEIRNFIEADSPVKVIDSEGALVPLTHRLTSMSTPPVEKSPAMKLELQENMIIGGKCDQIKFSQLTIDMYRILQTLEREPVDENSLLGPGCPGAKRENPHKYLLYKPTIENLLVHVSSGWKDLASNGVLLLYISGDTVLTAEKFDVPGYDAGGVSTCRPLHEEFNNKRNVLLNDSHCLYPGDLIPFMRKPLFLLVDSENSSIFLELVNPFSQPLVILMSPQEVPSFIQENHRGSLFTIFIHSPLTAFALVNGINEMSIGIWEVGLTFIDRFMAEASRVLVRTRNFDDPYIQFFGDDFLRLLILRYVFCEMTIKMNRSFQARSNQPKSIPLLSLECGNLESIILDLADHLGVSSRFFQ